MECTKCDGGAAIGLDPTDDGNIEVPRNQFRFRESQRRIFTEKKIGDELLAYWEVEVLPEDAVVRRVTLIPYRGERAVVAWRDGKLVLPEGDVAVGEETEAAIKRIAVEQAGILEPTAKHLGHLRCRATNASKTDAPGSITYQALYGVDVGGVADFPSDPAYERRIIMQRDLNTLVRGSYIEMRKEYTEALDRYLLERLKANLRG